MSKNPPFSLSLERREFDQIIFTHKTKNEKYRNFKINLKPLEFSDRTPPLEAFENKTRIINLLSISLITHLITVLHIRGTLKLNPPRKPE